MQQQYNQNPTAPQYLKKKHQDMPGEPHGLLHLPQQPRQAFMYEEIKQDHDVQYQDSQPSYRDERPANLFQESAAALGYQYQGQDDMEHAHTGQQDDDADLEEDDDDGSLGENADPDQDQQESSHEQDEESDDDGQGDEDSDDTRYEVCFVVQDVEFFTFKQNFLQQSQQFREIVASIEEGQQIRILLPLWSTARAFRIVLDFVNTNEMFWASGNGEQEGKDIYLMQNVLWLADFFQLHRLQKQCIDRHILPALNQGNIVTFVKDAYAKLLSSQEQLNGNAASLQNEDQAQKIQSEDIWYNFFNRCLEICSESLDFIVRERDQEMLDLPQTVVDEIFERALRCQQKLYMPDLIKFLLRYHRVTSVFQLYDIEKRKDTQLYQNLVRNHLLNVANEHSNSMHHSVRHADEKQKVKPLLCWRLQNLNLRQNFQKESEAFYHEGILWKVFLQKLNDKECQICLKYAQDFDRESQTRDGQLFFDKYSVLSLLSWTRLESEAPFGKGLIECPPNVPLESVPNQNQQVKMGALTISTSKSAMILRTVPLSQLTRNGPHDDDASLSIEVYFQLRPVLSLILNHITLHFSSLTIWPNWTVKSTWPIWPENDATQVLTLVGGSVTHDSLRHDVQHLSIDELSLILSHRRLGVSSEDEVIDCLAVWFGGFIYDFNHQSRSNISRLRDEQIMQLAYHINWPYVSFSKLLCIFRSFPRLRNLPLCKSILHNQILRRVTKRGTTMMSPPRCSYSSVMIETIFDYKFYIDKICEFMVSTFQLEQQWVARAKSLDEEVRRLRAENEALRNGAMGLGQENKRGDFLTERNVMAPLQDMSQDQQDLEKQLSLLMQGAGNHKSTIAGHLDYSSGAAGIFDVNLPGQYMHLDNQNVSPIPMERRQMGAMNETPPFSHEESKIDILYQQKLAELKSLEMQMHAIAPQQVPGPHQLHGPGAQPNHTLSFPAESEETTRPQNVKMNNYFMNDHQIPPMNRTGGVQQLMRSVHQSPDGRRGPDNSQQLVLGSGSGVAKPSKQATAGLVVRQPDTISDVSSSAQFMRSVVDNEQQQTNMLHLNDQLNSVSVRSPQMNATPVSDESMSLKKKKKKKTQPLSGVQGPLPPGADMVVVRDKSKPSGQKGYLPTFSQAFHEHRAPDQQ